MRLIKVSIFILLLTSLPLHAALEIKITQGIGNAMPIAIAPFVVSGSGKPPQVVDEIIKADLKRSGRFKPMESSEFPQQDVTAESMRLRLWREKGIDYLVVGSVREEAPGFYKVKFQLFDSGGVKQLAGYTIPADKASLRMAAHQASDLIYEAILGIRGAFNTRVAYITSGQRGGKKRYVMQIADSDGYNSRTILNSPKPLMSPAWSPDNKKIAFVSFEGNRSGVYVQDVLTGQRVKVSARKGINGAPSWSPDGSRLAVTLSNNGNPDIYVIDLGSKKASRLTRDSAIDTEPVWMPDGQSLIFTSDRSGKPQLYKVSASGGSAQRVTYEGDYNSAPTVSADGKKVAMVSGERGKFRIAVLDMTSGETRVLTDGRLDESPSFAPNGSMIIYATKEGGRSVLAAVSEDGSVRQTLTLKGGEVQEPDWSGFLN